MSSLRSGPKIKVLLVGSSFSRDIEIITRSAVTIANSHLCQTQYVGDLQSYKQYLANGVFQGEHYAIGYALDYKYKETEDLFDVIIYISEPNRGLDPTTKVGYQSSIVAKKETADSVHVFYLTKAVLTKNNFVVQYYGNNRTAAVENIIDILTKEWRYEFKPKEG